MGIMIVDRGARVKVRIAPLGGSQEGREIPGGARPVGPNRGSRLRMQLGVGEEAHSASFFGPPSFRPMER